MKYGWIPLIVLAGIALYGLAGFTANPLLYAPEKETAVSLYHENPAILTRASTMGTDDMLALMQKVLDSQAAPVAALQESNIPAMGPGLNTYDGYTTTLRYSAARTGINEGDIAEFVARTRDQGAILRAIVNQSETLDTLAAAGERGGNDSDVQNTIASQTAAVQNTELALLSRYLRDHAAVMRVSAEFGLDTGSYGQARDDILDVMRQIRATATPLPVNATALSPGESGRITLLVEPREVSYQDTVQVFGIVTPAGNGQDVTVLIDNAPIASAMTDPTGNYNARFLIERTWSGDHTLSAVSGNITSAEQVLSVTLTGTTTTLSAVPGYNNGTETGVYCNGSVMANVPVRNAPVTLVVDGQPATSIATAENGIFQVFLPLNAGPHTLTAQFSADGYPLGPSESNPVPVTVRELPIRLVDLLLAAGFVVLVTGMAAFWLLHHFPGMISGKGEAPAGGIPLDTKPPSRRPDAADLPPEIGTLFARYQALLRELGLSEAARRAYLDLAGRIAANLRLKGYRTLTPREMSGACSDRNYSGIFDIFIDSYERIRYGGSSAGKDRSGFEEELMAADNETGQEQA